MDKRTFLLVLRVAATLAQAVEVVTVTAHYGDAPSVIIREMGSVMSKIATAIEMFENDKPYTSQDDDIPF